MSNNKYGHLLDNVMNKRDTKALNSISRFRDSMNKQKENEIIEQNRIQNQRVQKEIAEQERIAKQNDYINSLLEKTKQRESAEARRKEEARRENEKREQSKKAMDNLNLTLKKPTW